MVVSKPLMLFARVRVDFVASFRCVLWVPEGFFRFRGEASIGSGEAAIEILASRAKSDIMLCLSFFEDFNGRSFFFGEIWETYRLSSYLRIRRAQ